MKQFFVIFVVALCVSTIPAQAGEDATNSWCQQYLGSVNGTGVVKVTCFYPSSWSNMAFQVSTGLNSTNNWSGVMLSEQVTTRTNSIPGQLPKSTTWFMSETNTNGVSIERRYYRLRKLP